ncbi:MAG: peptidoglycan-binding domain-containing protein [Solirubrobacterales bacterium]
MNKVLIMAMVAAVSAGPALARGSMDESSQSMRPQQQGMMDQGQQQRQQGQQANRDTVRQVQEQLNQQGYKVSVDGVWGPNTQQALRQYQQDKGISGNGQINNDTLAALGVEAGGTQQAQTPEQRQQSRQPAMRDQQLQQQRQQPRGGMGSQD